jgi:catechol 2,3-dioxygenase-like lactoylglutathione lyase family enzyme
MKTQRIDHVTVLTPDAAKATATFRDYFSLGDAPVGPLGAATAGAGAGAEGASALTIGGARIEFVRPDRETPLANALATSGEGMAALCLEVANLDDAARALGQAGIRCAIERAGGRRVIRIDPASAHGVRLALVDPAP